MERQSICFAKRGKKFPRFRHVLAIVLGCLYSASTTGANASPDFSKPTKDVIELCTWSTEDSVAISQKFLDRGWKRFRAPFTDSMLGLVADGYLLPALTYKDHNPLELDLETGVSTNLLDHVNTISEGAELGHYEVLWTDQHPSAFLLLSDRKDETASSDSLGCNYFSTSTHDATKIRNAIWAFNIEDLGETRERKYGPSRYLSATTWGYPSVQTNLETQGLDRKPVELINRPLPEPDLGAGPAKIWFWSFDETEFNEAFGRTPNTALALNITRRTIRQKQ